MFILVACDQKSHKEQPVRQDYLSKWFAENEDSLYSEFLRRVQATALCKTCDTTWGEMAYQQGDSISFMGKFSLEAKKFCDSIDVTYFYNKTKTPKARILLSVNYNRNYIKALDTVFNFITPRDFKVDKYEQPDLTADIFGLDNGDVVVKDLRVELTPFDTLQKVTVFIHGNPINKTITEDNRLFLKHQLFGEEILLKRISDVDFRFSDTISSKFLTLDEARSKLK